MEVTISIDDLHPEKGWGCEGDESVEYLQKLNDEFGCKFTLFIPSFYHKKYPLSEHKEWVDFLEEHDVPLLIFSAGVADVIEGILNKLNYDNSNVKILSNKMKFEENTNLLIGFNK